MKNVTKFIAPLVLCGLSSIASAYTPGWVEGKIDRIQTRDDGSVSIYLHNKKIQDPPRAICNPGTSHDIANPNSDGGKRIYSALLAYQAQNKVVQLYLGSCVGGVGMVTRVEDSSKY